MMADAKEPQTMASKKPTNLTIDFRSGLAIPDWVREVIDTAMACESEDAKSAGALGFMARALVIATMPYKDPKVDAFTRTNGDFRLRIVAGYEGGVPYGIYPRLLMSWVTTEAVIKGSPVIELGDSLRTFLRDVLDLRSNGGGARGSSTRVSEQMKRLFGSLVTAQYTGGLDKRGFTLKNVLIADDLDLDEEEMRGLDGEAGGDESQLWTPQGEHEAGQWRSQVRLSGRFFQECVTNPVPIDLRAYKSLRGSPLAMDVYTWLTYRMSYTQRRSRPIRWESLMMQFGSNYSTNDLGQAVRDFKKAFLAALKVVREVYPQADLEVTETGLVLLPSRPHVPKQAALF
jgi:hypothetical protein